MLNRLGLQAPGQPGRRRVPGGVPECLGRPAGPPEGSPGAPGAEEVFLRSECVSGIEAFLNRLSQLRPVKVVMGR